MWPASWTNGYQSPPAEHLDRARMRHLAEGTLIALLRCRDHTAMNDLIEGARSAGLSPYAVAAALVSVTAGEVPPDSQNPAHVLVRQRWGALLGLEPAPHQ